MIRLADLHEQFVRVANEQMIARGSEPDPEADLGLDGVTVGEFTRPLTDGFVGRVEFALVSSYSGEIHNGRMTWPPQLSVSLWVGLCYPPADRVQRLLESVTSSLYMVDLRDLTDPDCAQTGRLSDLAAVEHGVGQLVDAVDHQALTFLDQHASIDAFLALYRSSWPGSQRYPGSEWERFVVPAVLGAAGRTADAVRWLDDASGRPPLEGEPDGYAEYADRLRVWLQDGATVPEESELPPTPSCRRPPPEPDQFEPLDLGDREERHRESMATTEIVRGVRAAGTDLSRAARRERLLSELAARSIEKDPIWIETTLDSMELTDQQLGRQAGAQLFQAGRGIFSLLKNAGVSDDPDDDHVPAWMRPPENTWPRSIRHVARVIAIDLEVDSREFLSRVFETRLLARSPIMPYLDVWLAWDPAPRTERSTLAVHIGARRVGTVPRSAVQGYLPMIDAVQSADMWPQIKADLARLASGTFMLQVPLPQQP